MSFFTSRVSTYICHQSVMSNAAKLHQLFSAGIIARDEKSKTSTKLPENVVLLGVDEKKIEGRQYEREIDVIPDDCEIVRKVLDYPVHSLPPRTWLHSLHPEEYPPLTAVELHPEVFACHPRMDILHQCKEWQEKYREVDYAWAPSRAEMGRGRKKPWPQKGTGRARHGSTVAPQWNRGGIAHGPRGPTPSFQKIETNMRVRGLTSALTIKYLQSNLMITKDLSIPTPVPGDLKDTLAQRKIKDTSALLVYADDDCLDETSNIFCAVVDTAEINLMPLIALNVWSLLHHEWLVLTKKALEDLETKLTWHLHRYDWIDKPHNFYKDLPFQIRNSIPEQ